MNNSELYVTKLKTLITKLNNNIELIPLNLIKTEIPKTLDKRKLFANAAVIQNIQKAKNHIDSNRLADSFDLICSIPAQIKAPSKTVTEHDSYIGSEKVYILMAKARHYCRMIAVSNNYQQSI
jgi:hypothetical protein